MNNLKVQFKRLEKNPESNPGNTNTVAPYLEKASEGYVQGYINTHFGSAAVILHENKLIDISLKDIIVLTDEE